jgi:hypothetical protein
MTLTPMQLTERSHAIRRGLNDAYTWIEQDRKHMEPGSPADRQYCLAAEFVAEAIGVIERATCFPHQPRKESPEVIEGVTDAHGHLITDEATGLPAFGFATKQELT